VPCSIILNLISDFLEKVTAIAIGPYYASFSSSVQGKNKRIGPVLNTTYIKPV
jgi:hypothetical protein